MTKPAADANTATDGINELRTDVDPGMGDPSPSNSNLDNEHFDPNADNLIDTVDDVPGGIDLATGGASKQGTEEEEGKADDKGEGKDPGTEKTDKEAGAEVDDKGEEGKDPADAKASDDDKGKDYHEIPRFKELEAKVSVETERANKAEHELSLLRTQQAAPAAEKEELPFKPIQDLSPEEIAEWQNDDPQGYQLNLLAQAKHEIRQDIEKDSNTATRLSAVDTTYNTYQDANPDTKEGTGFMQMWESGAIKTYMQENPGHNAMSAHMKITEEARVGAQVAKAVADAEKKVTDDFKAKRVTDGLGQGPGVVPAEASGDNDLKDTSGRGGMVSVIAGRLFKSRQQQGG